MAAKTKSPKKIKRPNPPKASKKTTAADLELAAARTTIKKLKATVRLLEKNIAKADKKVEGLKAEIKKLRTGAVKKAKQATADGSKKVKKSKRVLDSIVEHDEPALEPAAEPTMEPAVEPASDVADVEPATEVVPVEQAPRSDLTVAQLKAAAREQGIPGYSRMRKDQLIAALA